MMKRVFKYFMGTSWKQKVKDVREYYALCDDLEISDGEKSDAFDRLHRVKSGPTDNAPGCIVYVEGDAESQPDPQKEQECENFLMRNMVFCDQKCPFYAKRKRYADECERNARLSQRKAVFWKNKIDTVIKRKVR